MFPYDTQYTRLQIQSRDYSTSFIKIRTDSMNRAFGIDSRSKKMDWTINLESMQNDLYLPSSSWEWQRAGINGTKDPVRSVDQKELKNGLMRGARIPGKEFVLKSVKQNPN